MGFDALKDMVPAILAAAFVAMLSKWSIDKGVHDSSLFVYLFFQSIIMFPTALLFNNHEKAVTIKSFFNLKTLWQPASISIVVMMTVLARVYAFKHTENPAYVTAIVMLAPFWVILFYKLVKHEEKGDVKSGIGIVICSIVLTILVVKG